MQLSSEIAIFGFTFYTQGLFFILALLFSLFAVWQEGRKDGFNEERLFDKYLLVVLLALLFSRTYHALEKHYLFFPLIKHVLTLWKPGLSLEGFFLGFIFWSFLLARLSKWSVFRILDIFSLALSFGAPVAILGYIALQKEFSHLIIMGLLLIFFGMFSVLRLKKLFSGLTFILFLVLFVVIRAFGGFTDSRDLIFYSILFTIIILVSVLRIKKSMSNGRKLPKSIFENLKSRLLAKREDIKEQENLLEEEDPYMQEGRAVGNSETVDEAYLEDTFKTVIDAQKVSVKRLKGLVKKALGKMRRGHYGVCEKCREQIDPARLEAYPEATLCNKCVKKAEAKQASNFVSK